MPELRFNPISQAWVIISTERAKRPEDFAGKTEAPKTESAADCPFCVGREDKTPAGFEVGSGMSIVSVIPEAAADFLRKA